MSTSDHETEKLQLLLLRSIAWCLSKALFIWSRVPETTLPPSYPGRANFSLISLKNSTNCLHENANSSQGGWGGGGGGDISGGRVVSSRQVG